MVTVAMTVAMTSRALVAIAGLAGAGSAGSMGCAQIFGLDETSNTGRTNTVEVTRMSIGTTVTTAPQDLTGLDATFFARAGTEVRRVTAAADPASGAWTVNLPDPAQVAFTLPAAAAPELHSYAFPRASLKVLFPVLEHPGPTPAPDGATITLTAPLDSAIVDGESFQTFTVGSWTARAFPPENVPLGALAIGPVSYPFSASSNLSGRAQLDRLTTQDAFFVLRYTGLVLSGIAEVPAFDQTGDDTLMAPVMTRLALDRTLDVTIDAATIATRYATVRPAVGALEMGWTMVAAPGYQVASTIGPVLAFGGLSMADLGVNLLYANPFAARGWNTILAFNTFESRQHTPPDPGTGPIQPIELRAGMDQYIEPSASRTALDLPAGLPRLVSINGNQLSADGQTISLSTGFVEVSFTTDRPDATLYNLQVFDLVPSQLDATQLVRSQVLFAAAAEPRFTLPPELFQLGHTYVLRASCTFGGYPNIASGDFVTRELPTAQSYLDSAVFTVTP